jgi:hypothetical protein
MYVKTPEQGNMAIGRHALRSTLVHDEYFSASDGSPSELLGEQQPVMPRDAIFHQQARGCVGEVGSF